MWSGAGWNAARTGDSTMVRRFPLFACLGSGRLTSGLCRRTGDLARILQDATENVAGAFGARGVPEAMRIIELIAIEQAREWGTCSVSRALLCRCPGGDG
jgi:hypothetical protein